MPRFRDILTGEDLRIAFEAVETLERGRPSHCDVALVAEREWRLPMPFWTMWVDALRKSADPHCAEQVFQALAQTARSFVLAGPALSDPPLVFGRLLDSTKFAALVRKAHPQLNHPASLRFLWDLTQADVDSVRHLAGRVKLGEYAMWSTFSRSALSDDPFEPIVELALLPIELGLEIQMGISSVRKYLMLAYELPDGVVARAPTIADAYAGGAPNARFRPFGLTHPTILDQDDLVGRPECIHEVVTGQCLVRPPGGIPKPGWVRSVVPR